MRAVAYAHRGLHWCGGFLLLRRGRGWSEESCNGCGWAYNFTVVGATVKA